MRFHLLPVFQNNMSAKVLVGKFLHTISIYLVWFHFLLNSLDLCQRCTWPRESACEAHWGPESQCDLRNWEQGKAARVRITITRSQGQTVHVLLDIGWGFSCFMKYEMFNIKNILRTLGIIHFASFSAAIAF